MRGTEYIVEVDPRDAGAGAVAGVDVMACRSLALYRRRLMTFREKWRVPLRSLHGVVAQHRVHRRRWYRRPH